MRVFIRHYDEADGALFDDVPFDRLEDVIGFIERSGGVYHKGTTEPFNSYQIVRDHNGAFAEIIIGKEPE